MTHLRAFLAGIIVWMLIFFSFTIMGFLPELSNSPDLQNGLILLLIIPFVILANWFYYKKGNSLHGAYLGLIIIFCCLVLDAVITLPFIIIPEGGSYYDFYTDHGLVIMGLEIVVVSYLYWRMKIKSKAHAEGS